MKEQQKLPSGLLKSLNDVSGYNEETFIQVHESGEQATSIRLNPLKQSAIGNEQWAIGNGQSAIGNGQSATANGEVNAHPPTANQQPSTQPIPWCSTGRYLSERPSFTFDPSFHAGAYYVQEASSMFIDHILKQLYSGDNFPSKVLDLCAAPGGKSTLLAAGLPQSFIVSNEVIKSRVTILAENISKWGSSNVVVTHNDPRHFQQLSAYFDLMVVDAPCSGSGLFRKDARAIEEWSEANVEMCSIRQQRILTDAIVALKKDGYLIYSTCSYSAEEDENICDWIMENLHLEPLTIEVDALWGIVETFSEKHKAPGYRFYPDKLKGEGFFIACFKQANHVDEEYISSKSLQSISKSEREIIQSWFKEMDKLEFFKQKETIIAYPKKFKEDVEIVQSKLNVRKSGVAIGTIKGKDLIPHHELALSNIVNDELPVVDVDYNNAINYLKRKDLIMELPAKGWTLVRYEGLNLGWMKVLLNRINNYYPPDWRILKD
jgi:16S rRNA C967 or C1407 C5-methylase (RsmB/RsmF family)/NOL1/NOP2/fmu family ribosome biogenesis protein